MQFTRIARVEGRFLSIGASVKTLHGSLINDKIDKGHSEGSTNFAFVAFEFGHATITYTQKSVRDGKITLRFPILLLHKRRLINY